MPLPASGQISFSQLAAELVNACTNIGLRAYSACANCTSPDGISELWGKRCTPFFGTGAWAVTGNSINARPASGAGTQNAGLKSASQSSYPYNQMQTEKYNGASWSLASNSSILRSFTALTGLQDNAILIGGWASSIHHKSTEVYNGTSWASGGLLQNLDSGVAAAGTPNAALAFGGRYENVNQGCNFAETYNGANWTVAASLLFGRKYSSGVGTSNAALAIGGNGSQYGGGQNSTEAYNGTTWSNVAGRPQALGRAAAAGTQNDAIAMGGTDTGTATCHTNIYNGATWSTEAQFGRGRYLLAGGGAGSSAAFITAGNGVQGGENGTDEFTRPLLCITLA